MTPHVVIAATTWAVNGVNVFSTNLARGLIGKGVPAHILITEGDTELVSAGERLMPIPAGVPFQSLPVWPESGWGAHWGAMLRHLEDSAPAVYIPNYDWRHSCICPRLSNNVLVVGVVHSDDPLHYDHVRRLGHTWNAIVAVSSAVARRTAEECPMAADRIVTIPIGVRLPAERPARERGEGPLRLVYHGALKQHQKRVFDLLKIVEAATAMGVPVELSIAGAGQDEDELRVEAAPLVERGLVRFVGVTSLDDTAALLDTCDVYLLPSEFEGMPNALLEAMASGCVPIVTRTSSGIPELIRDGENGFLVPVGDAGGFAERLQILATDAARRDRMSSSAFESVRSQGFSVGDMVESYRQVFDNAWREVRAGRFVRQEQPLSPPPESVAGVSVFPVALPYVVPDVGAFPSAEDADAYAFEVRGISKSPFGPRKRSWDPHRRRIEGSPMKAVTVIVAAPVWTADGVNRWSEDLLRGLNGAGVDARLLLTEESTALVTFNEPRVALPSDLTVEKLEVPGRDGWGARWGAMVSTLEAAAPCVYYPTWDWRHSCVVPALSDRVTVIGSLHGGSIFAEHAARLGEYWNGAVATSREVAHFVRQQLPSLVGRLTTIPHGVDVPATLAAAPPPSEGEPLTVLFIGRDSSAADAARLGLLARELAIGFTGFRVVVTDPPAHLERALSLIPVEFVLRPNRQQWLTCCASAHFVVIGTWSDEARRSTVETMGRGCIPVWLGDASPDDTLVRDGETAIVAPEHKTAASRMWQIAADPETRARLATAAHSAARKVGGYRMDQMIAAHLDVIQRFVQESAAGITHRPTGPVLPPPPEVDGQALFSPKLKHHTSYGAFPTRTDARRFRAAIRSDAVVRLFARSRP